MKSPVRGELAKAILNLVSNKQTLTLDLPLLQYFLDLPPISISSRFLKFLSLAMALEYGVH